MPSNPQADPPGASVARRITVIGGTCLLAVLAGICAVMTVMLSKRAQERTVYVTSLSKTVAPGLRYGAAVAPAALVADIAAMQRVACWSISPTTTPTLACPRCLM